MDVDEFLRRVTPAAQRSRLAPFWGDINKLRDSGCTLGQVCEFLAANEVQISIAGLSKYIKRREGRTDGAERVHVSEGSVKGRPVHAVSVPTPRSEAAAPRLTPREEIPIDQPDDLGGLSTKERRERLADQYIKPEATNPLLRNLREKRL